MFLDMKSSKTLGGQTYSSLLTITTQLADPGPVGNGPFRVAVTEGKSYLVRVCPQAPAR